MRVRPRTWMRAVGWLALAIVGAACQSGPAPTGTIPGSPAGATPTVAATPGASPTTVASGGLTADQVFALVSPAVGFVQTETGTGSGFAIDDRHVVTNAHVVRPSGVVTVRFAGDARPIVARVVGWDLEADLAVLEVPAAASRPGVGVTDGEAPRTGARVYLVGYPLADLTTPTATITEGIISGSPFEWVDGLTYQQTDAAIEDGQSGGVLVDERGGLLGVTGGSRGRLAIALDAGDALDRVARLLHGEDVDGMDDRVLPSPTADGDKSIDVRLRHRADVHAWLVPGAMGDPKVHVSMTSDDDVGLFALAAGGRLGRAAGPPSRRLTLDVDLDAPGPILVKVEPLGSRPVKVHLDSAVGLTPFDDPDDGRAITVDDPWMGAADYAGDIDWYTLEMAADEEVTIRASASAMDPGLFVDRAGATGAPLASGHDAGGPLGGDDELVFRAPKAGEYLVVVADVRAGGAGAYRLTVTSD